MKKSLKKKLLFSTLGLGIATASIGSIATFSHQIRTSSSIEKTSSSLNASAGASTPSTSTGNLFTPNLSTDAIDLSTPRQYQAFNNSNTQFAIINKSQSQQNGFDQVTAYDASTGQTKWTKKVSELNTSQQTKNFTNGKILAISYLQSNGSRDDGYLILVEDNSKTYLLNLKATDGTQQNVVEINAQVTSKTSGSSASGSSSNVQYFINVNNFFNLDVQILKIESSSSDINISSASISNFTSAQFVKQTLSTDLKNAFFSKEMVIASNYSDQNNLYFIFQQKNTTNKNTQTDQKFATILKIGKNQKPSDLTSTNFMNVNFDAKQIANLSSGSSGTTNQLLLTSQHLSNGENVLLISSKAADPNKQVYYVAKYNNNQFGNTNSIVFDELSSQNQGTILLLQPLYSNTNEISGFIGLNDSKKVVWFNKDFTQTQLYYDFQKTIKTNPDQTTPNEVSNIYTKENDSNWYSQSNDGTIYQFSGPNLIGKLSEIKGQERYEIISNVSFKEEKDIDSFVLFKNTNDSDFNQFVSDNASKFLNVNSYDPTFGEPRFTAKVISTSSVGSGKNKEVTISFKQNLRKKKQEGQIENDTDKSVLIGYQTFEFVNEEISLSAKEKSEIPQNILQKKPSEITIPEISQILNINNAGNYTVSLQPNDSFGTLTVNVNAASAWVAGELKFDYRTSITIGTPDSPYFMIDMLNGLSGDVELVTQEYLNQNTELSNELNIKYSSVLPSEISKEELFRNFIILGDAFSDNQLLNLGIIEAPTVNNIQVIPVDTDGYLYVTLTIPKVGHKKNITYSFKTASIFKQSATIGQNAFIVFKDESVVKETEVVVGNQPQKLGSYLPSVIYTQMLKNVDWLLCFADISYYVLNMIYNPEDQQSPDATLSIKYNNGLGQITISIDFKKEVQGLSGKSFSKTFNGFATQGNSGAPTQDNDYPTFSWGSIDNNQFSGKTASDITVETIDSISSKLFTFNGASSTLRRDVTVTPLNASAAVLVTITFYEWWEKQKIEGQDKPVLLPEKSFSTVLTNGLSSSKESVNSIIWKSYQELGSNIKSSTADNALAIINSSAATDIDKLKTIANISNSLERHLRRPESNMALSITSNNATGTIEAFVRFTLNGITQSLGTTISGFNLEASNYVVTLANDNAEILAGLREFLPSQLSDEQVGSLVNVQLGNNLTKKITTEFDDIKGILVVKVQLIDITGSSTTPATAEIERTYTGFKTNVPQYGGTNYYIVVAAILIPFVLLLSPILYILLYKNKKDIKTFAKSLDNRLSEHSKRKKVVEVNKIEDLLEIEKD